MFVLSLSDAKRDASRLAVLCSCLSFRVNPQIGVLIRLIDQRDKRISAAVNSPYTSIVSFSIVKDNVHNCWLQ
jgi:hypothetical protein